QAIWLDDLPVGVMVGATTSQKLHYIEPDHLGTPRVVIDPVRDVAVWTWDLKGEAFGNTVPNQDPDTNGTAFVFNMRYPGMRADSASGLYQNGQRDYEAATGRYPESDVVGLLGGISTYGYAVSNPMTWFDPDGMQARPSPQAPPGPGRFTPPNLPPANDPIFGPERVPGGGSVLRMCMNPITAAIVLMGMPSNIGQPERNCSDDPRKERPECRDGDDGCEKEWREARRLCQQLIYEQMLQAAGRRKKRSVTGVTGGYTDVEECARGLVSERCGGNRVR
ncbi:MAG: RHS repeat-associated core domain-containing protein, partial [Pseudomonadota bacterium]|nr:RHS repeat-associated core domain-containing protein [Pseudomonadota bacterium]